MVTVHVRCQITYITRQKYQKRLAKFLDSGLLDQEDDKTIEQKAWVFAESGRKDPNWAFSTVVKFVQSQRDRVNRKEITGANGKGNLGTRS